MLISDSTIAFEYNPNYANAYNNRGNARLQLKDYQGALSDSNKAIEINPNDANPYYNRSWARAFSGDKAGAIADLQKSAELFEKQGRKAQAQKALQIITRLKNL